MMHEGHVRRPNTPSGVEAESAYQRWLHAEDACPECDGEGLAEDGSGDLCPTCVGELEVDRQAREEYVAERRAEDRMHDAGL